MNVKQIESQHSFLIEDLTVDRDMLNVANFLAGVGLQQYNGEITGAIKYGLPDGRVVYTIGGHVFREKAPAERTKA